MATRAARSGSGTGGQPGAASSSCLVAGMRPVVASFGWPRWLMMAVGRCGCGCRTVWLSIIGKCLVIQGVRFAYGEEQVLAALESDGE